MQHTPRKYSITPKEVVVKKKETSEPTFFDVAFRNCKIGRAKKTHIERHGWSISKRGLSERHDANEPSGRGFSAIYSIDFGN